MKKIFFAVLCILMVTVISMTALAAQLSDFESFHGSTDVTYEDGAMQISSFLNPGTVFFTEQKFENYEMEAEMQLNSGSWMGIMYRAVGNEKGLYMLGSGSSGYHQIRNHTTVTSGSGYSSDIFTAQNGYSIYEAGTKVKIMVRVEDNLITIQTKMVGDSDYFTEFDKLPIATELHGEGYVGFCLQKVNASVYNVTIKDLDSNYTYASDFGAPSTLTPKWEVIRDSFTPEFTDDAVVLSPIDANPAFYGITNIDFKNYVMETEYEVNKQWGGICFRINGSHRGILIVKTTAQSLQYHNTAFGTAISSSEEYTNYSYGDRIRLRVTVKDNILSIESMIVGKDANFSTVFENVDISTIYDGKLGTSGGVGLATRYGANMKVYEFTVTDTDTGEVYSLPEAPTYETEVIENSVVLDGNIVFDTKEPMSQIPDTLEVWFKTENPDAVSLVNMAWRDVPENQFALAMTDDAVLRYRELNGDVELRVSSKVTVNDGEWHKAVVRRYYDAEKGLLKVELSVYTGGVLVSRSAHTQELVESKQTFYKEDNNTFVAERVTYVGYSGEYHNIFVGELGEIRMWDFARSDEEISTVYKALEGTEEGLIYCFVPNGNDDMTDIVTSKTGDDIVNRIEIFMDDYVFGAADFRIAVLPDTQHFSEKFDLNIRDYFTWIRDNAERLNIKLVVSVGDMVNKCTAEQLQAVSEASAIIDGVVPFMPLMGNHDYPNSGRDSIMWNEYFPYAKYSAYDIFGGAYEEGKMDNYYYLMEINGSDYLFLALEFSVRPAVAAWANEVVASHPNHKVIVVNHAYMNHDGVIMDKYDRNAAGRLKNDDGMEATDLYDCLISKHDNIVLVLCGHTSPQRIERRTDTINSGHVVNSLCLDMSPAEMYLSAPGILGMLSFTDGSNTVMVNAYSTERECFFRTDNQFEIELDWCEEYRATFVDANGEIFADDMYAKDAIIAVPSAPENYSDGKFDYTFKKWDGFSEGLTASQNYTFTAVYTKTNSVTVIANNGMDESIELAKDALLNGDANAYVKVASNADGVISVCAADEYSSESKFIVFGEEVNAWYTQNGELYLHVLAVGCADKLEIITSEKKAVINVNAFEVGESEITTPTSFNRSGYDIINDVYKVTITGEDKIALTVSSESGENAVVYFDGEYILIPVSHAFDRNVAVITVDSDFDGEITLVEKDFIATENITVTKVDRITADGNLDDWNENILNTGCTMNGIGTTADKNVTFYAYLAENGLYVAAIANHAVYVNNATSWDKNTHLEFSINGESINLWISANQNNSNAIAQGKIVTTATDKGYISVAEGFVAMADLPKNALSGELNIGFTWQTPGDTIKYHNMTSGSDEWYLSNRGVNVLGEQYFVNAFGLTACTMVRTENNIKLDGDFGDFNVDALSNSAHVKSADGTVGYDLYAQYTANGVYVGFDASHKTLKKALDTYTWSESLNFQFYIGENQYYVTSCGGIGGNGLYAKNVYCEQTYEADSKLYNTKIELFIPRSALGTVNNEDYLRMNFAFNPIGENVVLEGSTVATDMWSANTDEQFYVYDCGISNDEIKGNGDVNGDGVVTILDVMLSLKAAVNDAYIRDADVNSDGKIGLLDVLKILKMAVA